MVAVWPSEARSFDFDGVSESYAMAADVVDGLLFPAGEAWRAAWRRDPSAVLYGPDGFHPSPAGSYAAAAVMFEQIAGRSAAGLPAALELRSAGSVVLDAALAALLQESAGEANLQFARVPG